MNTAGQPALTAADLVAIKNGAPLPDTGLNKQLLLHRTLQLARSATSAFHLRELHQICTYDERRALDERALQIEQDKNKLRLHRAELRELELALRQSTAADNSRNLRWGEAPAEP